MLNKDKELQTLLMIINLYQKKDAVKLVKASLLNNDNFNNKDEALTKINELEYNLFDNIYDLLKNESFYSFKLNNNQIHQIKTEDDLDKFIGEIKANNLDFNTNQVLHQVLDI